MKEYEEGFTRDVILDTVDEEKCDPIGISTRGLTGLGRVVLGSVADHVIRHATCPIITIHPHKAL